MASERVFQDIPSFPKDVPMARMYTVPLKGLCSGDASTAEHMFTACQELGFFLLDLRGDELGEAMMEEIDQVFEVSKELLSLPQHVKDQHANDVPRSFTGFKARGTAKTETGEPDRHKWFNLSQIQYQILGSNLAAAYSSVSSGAESAHRYAY